MNEHYPDDETERKAFWKAQLECAKSFMQPYIDAGVELVKMFNNMPRTNREKGLEFFRSNNRDNDTRVKANFVFAMVEQGVAGMTDDNEIEFNVSPKKSISAADAPVVKANLDHWYRETEQVEEDDLMALDAHLMPFAVKRLGWTAEFDVNEELQLLDLAELLFDDPEEENGYLALGDVSSLPRVERDQDHPRHIEVNELVLDDLTIPQEVRDMIVKPHIQRHKDFLNNIQPAPSSTVRWQAPFGTRWMGTDFLMDPFALQGIKDARWIAFRIRQPVYRWKSNSNYTNTDGLTSNCGIAGEEKEKDDRKRQKAEFTDFGMCEGWEIWARDFPVSRNERQNLLVLLVEDHPHLLQHEPWPDEYNALDDYPAEVVKFQDNLSAWLNKPMLVLAGADNHQTLINEFMDAMLYSMRKEKTLYLYDTQLFKKEEIQDILGLPDQSVFGVEGLAAVDGKAVQVFPMGNVPKNDWQQMIGILTKMRDDTAGTPEPIRQAQADTATVGAIIERRISAREDRRFRRFRKMQVNTGRKWWQLQTQFRPDMADLIDPRTGKAMQVTDEIARGEFRFSIDVASKRTSAAVRESNALKRVNLFFGIAASAFQMGIQINLAQILEDALIDFGYKDIGRYLIGSADEYQKALQNLVNDPVKMQTFIQSLSKFPGGGDQVFGSVGPALPQLQAANPTTEARQMGEAQRLEG